MPVLKAHFHHRDTEGTENDHSSVCLSVRPVPLW